MTKVLLTDTLQDLFLFAIIVPVLPFALKQQRSNLSDDEGTFPDVAVLSSNRRLPPQYRADILSIKYNAGCQSFLLLTVPPGSSFPVCHTLQTLLMLPPDHSTS